MLSPKELQSQLAAKREREKKLVAIKLLEWTYAAGEAQLDGKEGPDPDEGYILSEAAGRTGETLCGDIDLAAKRIALVRIREQEGAALKRQADHARRQRETFLRCEREDREREAQRAKERAELNSEGAGISAVINAAQQARIELFSLPLDEADAREETETRQELDAVNANILEIQRFNRDHSALASFPNYQDLQDKKSRLTNKLEFIKARRCEVPDFDFERELLDEADSPEKS
jgi:hypothetical protein